MSPRRRVLDKILVDAAVGAGVELRERFAVHELLWRDDRVVGIRGRKSGGAMVDEEARLVVGADGQHSTVAAAVHATRYNERPALTCAYYSYFSNVRVDGLETVLRPGRLYIMFPTNDDLTCVAVQVPVARFPEFRSDIQSAFYQTLDELPEVAARVRAGTRVERWLGTVDLENFFRKPFGRGWALVGDADYHKDPFLAQGISDAFRDAELLAEAIHAMFRDGVAEEDALAAYERRRNEIALPAYEQNCAVAAFPPLPAEVFADRLAKRARQQRLQERAERTREMPCQVCPARAGTGGALGRSPV